MTSFGRCLTPLLVDSVVCGLNYVECFSIMIIKARLSYTEIDS